MHDAFQSYQPYWSDLKVGTTYMQESSIIFICSSILKVHNVATCILLLRGSCLMLEFRCYEAKIEESEKASSHRKSYRIVSVGGCLAVVAQWQRTGGSSQRYPGLDSW